MAVPEPEPHAWKPKPSVMKWLFDSDPSIRWQVMRDLGDESADVVAAERSRVASEGWGAHLLDRQRPDGKWGDGASDPQWASTLHTFLLLRQMGLDPMSERARTTVSLIRDKATWGPEFGNSRASGVREGKGGSGRGDRRTGSGARVSARAPHVPQALVRRCDRSQLDAVIVSDHVALRRAAG